MSIIAAVGFRSALSGWSFVTRRRHRRASARRRSCSSPAGAGCCSARASPSRPSASSLLGGIAVGGIPTPGAYGAFARGLVDGWADLLSSAPPADITEQLRALPFTVAWLAAADRRRDRPPLPPPRPAGDRPDPRPRPEPAVHRRGALARPRPGRRHPRRHAAADHGRPAPGPPPASPPSSATSSTPAASSTNRSRLMLGAVVVVGAVVAAPLLGPHLPLRRGPRALRPAPLPGAAVRPAGRAQPARQVKASLKDERKDDVVFTVAGDTPVDSLAGRRDDRLRRRHLDRRRPRARPGRGRVRPRRHPAARARRAAARRHDDGRAHRRDHATSAATSCPPPARPRRSTFDRRPRPPA